MRHDDRYSKYGERAICTRDGSAWDLEHKRLGNVLFLEKESVCDRFNWDCSLLIRQIIQYFMLRQSIK